MNGDLNNKNKKVQAYGWSTLITVVGFACALFAVSNWLISPVSSSVSFFQGQIESLNKNYDSLDDKVNDQCATYIGYVSDTKRRDQVQERDLMKLDNRVSELEKLIRGY